jgi:hypothetical protein
MSLGLKSRLCHIIVLNDFAPTQDKRDDSKDSFYDKLEQVFNHFPKILLGDFISKFENADL